MKNKKHIILFVLIIALVQFTFQWTFRLLGAGENEQNSFLFQYAINLPACIFIGMIDFFIIHTVYKKFRKKDNIVRILIDLLLSSIFIVVFAVVANSIISPFDIYDYIIRTVPSLIIWNTIIVLLIEIFFYNQRQVEADKKMAIIEKEKIQYQYETLKAQVNPHFLFNSLNVLSSLAYKDAEKANLFAKKMSGVYRYLLLTNDRPVVTLSEELSFLESYIFLEKIRFEDALFVEIIHSDSCLNKKVIPVSLQLLVENALKHNITSVSNPLVIRIYIAEDRVTVSNPLQLRSSVDKGGVGLKNLQKQYALYNKTIRVIATQTDFTVSIPFIDS